MKTLKKMFLFLAAFYTLASCSKTDSYLDEKTYSPALPVNRTIPFDASFTGNYTYFGADSTEVTGFHRECSSTRVIIDGNGKDTNLGDFSFHLDLCRDMQSGNFYGPNSYLFTNQGDILFISVSGKCCEGRCNDHPSCVNSYWKNSFNIIGGTGVFAGATGELISDDFTSKLDPYTHHRWKGNITINRLQ